MHKKYVFISTIAMVSMVIVIVILSIYFWDSGGLPLWTTEIQAVNKNSLPKESHVLRENGRMVAYYHWYGKGPSLLLIPGSWNEYRQYDALRRHLTEGLNLVIVELPGHGDSQPPATAGSIESFADDVLAVVESLGWKQWYVGGHSIGGMVAIELASRHPNEIAGVISIEGWTHFSVLNKAFDGRLCNTLSTAQGQQRQKDSTTTLGRLNKDERTAFSKIWQCWDGEPILQTISVRILELWGDRNQAHPSRELMKIPDRDNIQLRWIAGASHYLPLERPEEVAASINEFIAAE